MNVTDEQVIQADKERILEYICTLLADLNCGKMYKSSVKTAEYLLWCVKDMEALTSKED